MGYLVFSRRLHERIQIGDDIEILVSDISFNKVNIAIKAPKNVKVKRRLTHVEEEKQNEPKPRNKPR